jgi:farnesyl-diphosphate farnesyltransferase
MSLAYAKTRGRKDSKAEGPRHSTQTASHDDWRFCAELLPKVSRTFALSIGALPDAPREAIRVAYLLCRIVDTIEDETDVRGSDRERLYDTFDLLMADERVDPTHLEEQALRYDLGAGSDDAVLCRGAGAVFRCFRELPYEQQAAMTPHVEEMSRGMRLFTRAADSAGKLRLRSLDDLEHYCYFVAGTVGKLLTALFELEVPDLDQELLIPIRARSVSFGIALQMVNIVKDVAEDLERGDCFIPEELAENEGIRLEDMLDSRHRDAGLRIIGAVCDRAREHLARAQQYTLLWPTEAAEQLRLFCAVPLVLALATLREVEEGSDALKPGRTPKITRQTVHRIWSDAHVAVKRNDTLRWMIGYYAGGAYLNDDALPMPARRRI